MRIFILVTMIASSTMTFGQWNPATTDTAPAIYRNGNVAIGTVAANDNVKLYVESTTNSGGDNTVRFAAPNIGPVHSHIHWGTTGDWYIRSATTSGKIMIQDTGGKVGIGPVNPEQRLHIYTNTAGDYGLRIQGNSNAGPGISLWDGAAIQNKWLIASGVISGTDGKFLIHDQRLSAHRFVIDTEGKIGMGVVSPAGKLHVSGDPAWDTSTKVYITNGSSDYGRTNLILTGRMQAGNDAWSFGTNARNSIVFSSNNASSGQNIGGIGAEQFSIQHEQLSNKLGFLSQSKGSSPVLVMTQSGSVGIGEVNPEAKLHVTNAIMSSDPNYPSINVRLDGTSIPVIRFSRDTDGTRTSYHNAFVGQFYNSHLGNYSLGIGTGISNNQDGSTTVITIPTNGNVGIGTTTPDHKLTVDGNIRCEEVKVEIFTGTGPDYVFEKDYELLALSEIESYIQKHKHLPEVPSAKEMEENGLDLKEMNLTLLKKVEELTLYVIQQQKTNNEQSAMIKILMDKLSQSENK